MLFCGLIYISLAAKIKCDPPGELDACLTMFDWVLMSKFTTIIFKQPVITILEDP
jgi:hypothetical protein